jgi:hypothetical protein
MVKSVVIRLGRIARLVLLGAGVIILVLWILGLLDSLGYDTGTIPVW